MILKKTIRIQIKIFLLSTVLCSCIKIGYTCDCEKNTGEHVHHKVKGLQGKAQKECEKIETADTSYHWCGILK